MIHTFSILLSFNLKPMIKIVQILLLCLMNFTLFGQAEIVLTYDGKLIPQEDGLRISKMSYPLVRLAIVGEMDNKDENVRLEVTLIRMGRAVRSMRSMIDKGNGSSLQNVMRSARSGDELIITVRDDLDGLKNRVVKYSIL